MFEHHVDAALASDASNFIADFLGFVVNDVVGAELLCFLELGLIPRSGDHSRTKEFGDLDRGASDTAASAEDEYIFSGLQLSAGYEHVPGGLKNKRDGRGFLKGQVFRKRQTVYFRGAHEFCAAAIDHVAQVRELAASIVLAGEASGALTAGNAGRKDDFLADTHGRDVSANLSNLAGDVAAGNVRERKRNARDAAAHPEVEMIQRAGLHAHKNFVCVDDWL